MKLLQSAQLIVLLTISSAAQAPSDANVTTSLNELQSEVRELKDLVQ